MIIERPKETKQIKETRKWLLIYGRRKTGKTFLVKNFISYSEYFFIKRDRTVIADSRQMTYETFIEVLKMLLSSNKTAVVDEFHRLGDDFFDFLHQTDKKGRVILISSTLFLSKKLTSSHSPLLGFFAEMPLGLISLNDTLKALSRFKIKKKEILELAVLLREPIAIDYFDEKEKARKILKKILLSSIKTIPALVGEIFIEEERSISAVYEGVLRAVASGKVISTEISDYLFSRNLIKKNDPSVIQQYLNNLIEFGIIKRLEVYNKNYFTYRHISPLARIFYYADEKYNFSERKISEDEMEKIIDELMPRILEDNLREFFAEKFGLKEAIIEAADYEIDACFLKFKKPDIVMEIKWKKTISKKDVAQAEKNLARIKAKKKLMFVPDKKGLFSDRLSFLDCSDILN